MNPFWAFVLSFVIVLILIFLLSLAFKYTKTFKKERKILRMKDLGKVGRTGDLLLFSSNNKVIGFVKALFGTEFLHSGILYFKPGDRTPYVWESARTPDTVRDSLTDELSGIQKSGVQVRNLRKLVKIYDGYVVLFPLRPSFEETHGEETLQITLLQLMEKYKDAPFAPCYSWMISSALLSLSPFHLTSQQFLSLRRSLVKDSGMLCTEVTTRTYEALGIWNNNPPGVPPEIYFAHHFLFHGFLGNRDWDSEFELVV